MAVRWKWKRLFRFSIGGLLLAAAAVAVYFGANRAGHRAGARQRYDESYFVKVYQVADLVVEGRDEGEREELSAEIVDHVRSTVAPQTWDAATDGGMLPHVEAFADGGSLVISQHGAVHRQIDAALDAYRRRKSQKEWEQAATTLDELATERVAEPAVLMEAEFSDSLESAALLLRFEGATAGLTEKLGRPKFSGECTEPGFPAWSAAQSIAVWRRGDGEAYLAVQDWPTGKRALVIGWRGE